MNAQTTVDEVLDRREQPFAEATHIPSDRDFAVYRYVKIERWTTRHMVKHAPVLTKEESAQRMEASRQLAAEKLDYLYGQAMDCFYRSKTGPRDSAGTARYANLCSRLILASAKLPPPLLREYETAEDSEEAAVDETADDDSDEFYDEEYLDDEFDDEDTSPEEDCSAAPLEQHAAVTEPPPPSSPTVAAMLSCVEQ